MTVEQQVEKPANGQNSSFRPASVILGVGVGVVFTLFLMNITGVYERRQNLVVINTTNEAIDLEGLMIEPGRTGHFSLPDREPLEVNGIPLATFELKTRTGELLSDDGGHLEFRFTDE